jgi:hypothetical protein
MVSEVHSEEDELATPGNLTLEAGFESAEGDFGQVERPSRRKALMRSSNGEINSYYRKLETWEHPHNYSVRTDDTLDLTSSTQCGHDTAKSSLHRTLKAGYDLE